MHDAVAKMMSKYTCRNSADYTHALREILQEIALLGLWRSKFFEKTAFYGGTALRILYGLDRFSEDLDFSLLAPSEKFQIEKYTAALEKELRAFGFNVHVELINKAVGGAVQSAFLKTNTLNELLIITIDKSIVREIHRDQVLKIKLEVDTDPPPGFSTESKYLLHPIPFAVRTYTLPDLFAGKMHAVLFRNWKNRVKGRDWYDLVWYVANHPELRLSHLEQRMRQSGHWSGSKTLDKTQFIKLLHSKTNEINVDQARLDVAPFVKHPESLDVWSIEFFHDIISRIETI
ncbi:MAG: nucleotidyl transferase AbiEii/AbiGii toxin family protein [Desulfobulbaceae bacterium]|uniref:Nucleotidyl transferase AbiEii/AbiGii toxin family protein n=1 Tax=Candidatus Desulfobia pelagia TaxID=2841692 RepID=A0A8J6NBG6_9BACT|nr:nucleotidyl transferase AbiEii/AbiGii toxin family protein [Candidatus Desulfobia pelagia]